MLLDSNIVIYAFDPAFAQVTSYLRGRSFSASVVTQIEVMGFWRLSEEEYQRFEAFFRAVNVIELSPDVVKKAIVLRRMRSMGLADAVIAATALVNGLPLVTHNTEDFRGVEGLDAVRSPVRERSVAAVVVDAAIEVHRTLGGPGLLENIYEEALV